VRNKESKVGLSFLLVMLAMALLIIGCSRGPKKSPAPNGNEGGEEKPQEVAETVMVTLYFADDQAEKLIGEERDVTLDGESLAEAVVKELIKGSETGLGQTIPDGTRLLDLDIEAGVAYVDFSREFKENHWGGSAGEIMTVYSVVNSLAQLEGIDQVQFLLEGEEVEDILGHMYYGEPIKPDWDLVE
jgi:germination protein M